MRWSVVVLTLMAVIGVCAFAGGAVGTGGKRAAAVGPAKKPVNLTKNGSLGQGNSTRKAVAVKQIKPVKARSLVLLYTSSARGQIRSCNCTKFRFGGYGRQLTLLKSIRASNPDVVLIEGGDITGGSGFQARLKGDVAAQALGLLGYGAVVLGDEELGLTGDQTVKHFEKKTVPLVCANLYENGAKEPKYKPYVVLTTRGGMRVGVIGALDKSLGGEFLEKSFGQSVSDPVQAVGKYVPAVRKTCDLVVVLYHGVPASAGKLAGVRGVDLVLCTHRHAKENLFPGKESNVVNVRVDKPGKAYVIDAGTNENWSLGRLDVALGPGREVASVSHTLVYLDRRYSEDPQMVKIYEAYNERVTTAVLSESSKLRQQGETMLAKRGVDVAAARTRLRKTPFAGAESCEECHSDTHESWAATRHARAIESLKSTKQEYDPECVGCHVTGMTTRNGYSNYKETPELANVQCEACHGPALEHTKSPEAGFGKADEQTCRSCHTEDRDAEFDYEAYWGRVKH